MKDYKSADSRLPAQCAVRSHFSLQVISLIRYLIILAVVYTVHSEREIFLKETVAAVAAAITLCTLSS